MTREEAIEVYHGLINTKIKEAFEFFAPELTESEDERIRKELIGMINECTNWAHKKEYVKYLEKQKEHPKSADSIPSDCVSNAKCENRSPKHTDSFGTDIRDTPAYWRGWDDAMKQKEQKPVEVKDPFSNANFVRGYESGYADAKREQKPVEGKEQPSEDLEEAAEKMFPVYWKNYPKDGIVRSESSYDTNKQCRGAFIAGAEWQKEQMLQLAKNRYEVIMAFGTGNPDVDHALQMDRLALVEIIKEGSK